MAMVVVLPAPLPPSRPERRAGRHGEADVVDRQRLPIALGQVRHLDRVHGGGIVRPRTAAKGRPNGAGRRHRGGFDCWVVQCS